MSSKGNNWTRNILNKRVWRERSRYACDANVSRIVGPYRPEKKARRRSKPKRLSADEVRLRLLQRNPELMFDQLEKHVAEAGAPDPAFSESVYTEGVDERTADDNGATCSVSRT